jgi:cytochrome c553
MSQSSEPHDHDQPWRLWASIAVFAILLAGILLGVVVIPVVQGRGDGIDAFTAICRALGILPGSPARQQVVDRTPPTPVSQVVWTPDVLRILAAARPERGRAKALEVCAACHGEQGVSARLATIRTSRVSRVQQSTSSLMIIGRAVEAIR